MKFAFFGSSLVSSYWNGAATYYRGIIRYLHARGHAVTFYEPDAYERQAHRDMPDPEWARVVIYAPTLEAIEDALDDASAADVIIKTSGVGVFDQALEQGVLTLRKPGKLVVFWDVDAPATLDEVLGHPDHPFRTVLPRFDLVLTYGGGDPVVSAYAKLGARCCVPVYNALDPLAHHPVSPDPRFSADLGFLGNRLPDREERVDCFFLEVARRLPDMTFMLGGNGWDDKTVPANVRRAGHVYTRDHNAFNASARAVLNINRDSMARYGFSPATRVFEAAGAAACIMTDAFEGVGQFLEPGREILVAHDGADVAAHLENLDGEQARDIGRAARRRVLAHHTYAHRARQVEALLEGLDESSLPLREIA
jgi:spore maturation protein CgeB